MAISLLVGNLFYALQARRLAQESGPSDATALPGLIGLWRLTTTTTPEGG
ncbi:hypothetical protein [Methylomonas sp. HYX-M1]